MRMYRLCERIDDGHAPRDEAMLHVLGQEKHTPGLGRRRDN